LLVPFWRGRLKLYIFPLRKSITVLHFFQVSRGGFTHIECNWCLLSIRSNEVALRGHEKNDGREFLAIFYCILYVLHWDGVGGLSVRLAFSIEV
jgi:hypothetical protein